MSLEDRVAFLAGSGMVGPVDQRAEWLLGIGIDPGAVAAAHVVARRAALRGETLHGDGSYPASTSDPAEAVLVLAAMLDGGQQSAASGPVRAGRRHLRVIDSPNR